MSQSYNPLPPASDLWERFDYKPLTGELIFRTARGNQSAGATFGCPNAAGYVIGGYNGRLVYAHRLIYKWYTGNDLSPYDDIDHIDGDRTNNKCWNLRSATRTQNCFNRKAKGYVKVNNRFYAKICVGNRKVIHLGAFDTPEKAAAAYAAATLQYHGSFANPF